MKNGNTTLLEYDNLIKQFIHVWFQFINYEDDTKRLKKRKSEESLHIGGPSIGKSVFSCGWWDKSLHKGTSLIG